MPSDEGSPSTTVFERPELEVWEAAATAALRGRPLDGLTKQLPGGIEIEPLYTLEQHGGNATSVPGTGDHRRGATAASTLAGWDIRQRHDAAAPSANDDILNDLERGATSIALANPPADPEVLGHTLDGMFLDMAGVHLDGGHPEALLEVWADRNIGHAAIGSLGHDPLGRLATTGTLDRSIDDAMARLVELSDRATDLPMVTVARADGRPYANAGASAPDEIAAVLATGVAYLRALVGAGREVDTAVDDLTFTLTVDADQFLSIAKLRAARICWARIIEASGGNERGMRVHAETASTMLTTVDPWVNMLRTTIACFAAACGGATAITTTPFDAAIGQPDDLGLRIARNVQLILAEETGLGSVVDPAGGSYFVEQLTDQLATQAWARFQDIERQGGMGAALAAGTVQASIADSRESTAAAVATRRSPITGVTEFPDLTEGELEREPITEAASPPDDPVVTCNPLGVHRPSEPYEALRGAAATAGPPTVFSANLGPIASHNARATFAANLLAVGGITTTTNGGFDGPDQVTAAFEQSNTTVAVICGSDPDYETMAADTARALKAAGATHVVLAGAPGNNEDAYRAAGIDAFIHIGVDVLDTLTRLHAELEVAS